MFFEETKVYDLLSCSRCKNKLDDPRILPCGFTICSNCQSSIILLENQQFKCLVCNNWHFMPERSLPMNLLALDFLNIRPIEVYRGKIAENLKKSLKSLNESISIIDINAKNEINEYYTALFDQTNYTLEDICNQIKNFGEQLIGDINNFEKNNILALQSNEKNKQEFMKMVKKLTNFHTKWSEDLKKSIVNDDEILNANNQAIQLIKQVEDIEVHLDSQIFNNRILKFKENPNKLNESLLVSLITKRTQIISSSILSEEQLINLMNLCEFPLWLNLKLLYRATRDGWESAEFHSKCDDKANTFAIIKTTKGFVFGGYTEQSWSNSQDYKSDPNAFIFSFLNSYGRPSLMKCVEPTTAIFGHNSYGPIFGQNDITITLLPLSQSRRCTSQVGNSYSCPEFVNRLHLIGGGFVFELSEIEIYTKE